MGNRPWGRQIIIKIITINDIYIIIIFIIIV